MGVRITTGSEAVLYCSTTMWAFGPVFDDYDDAEAFLEWWKAKGGQDLRLLTDAELEHEHFEWRKQKDRDPEPDPETQKWLREELDAFTERTEALRKDRKEVA
jgi:hypothetical protein